MAKKLTDSERILRLEAAVVNLGEAVKAMSVRIGEMTENFVALTKAVKDGRGGDADDADWWKE
jgi:hypothetical protein